MKLYTLTVVKNLHCIQSSIEMKKDETIKVLARLLMIQPISNETLLHIKKTED